MSVSFPASLSLSNTNTSTHAQCGNDNLTKRVLQMVEVRVPNLDCEGCATKLKKALFKLKGTFSVLLSNREECFLFSSIKIPFLSWRRKKECERGKVGGYLALRIGLAN